MGWWHRFFGRGAAGNGTMSKLEHAVEKAARDKAVGWYTVKTIKVHKVNPITDYVVDLEPTTPPPGESP